MTIDGLKVVLEELKGQLDERRTRNDANQRAFDQLYEELRQYKDDFIFQAEKPLLLDLLLFHDSLCWFKENLAADDTDPAVVSETFQYLVDEFLELLYRRDVVPLSERKTFNRTVHKAIQVLPTTDPEQDYQVQQVIKRGFLRGEKLLRPEEVVIFRQGTTDTDDED